MQASKRGDWRRASVCCLVSQLLAELAALGEAEGTQQHRAVAEGVTSPKGGAPSDAWPQVAALIPPTKPEAPDVVGRNPQTVKEGVQVAAAVPALECDGGECWGHGRICCACGAVQRSCCMQQTRT